MKYLYKGMAVPGASDVSGSVLLAWHEKVCLGVVMVILSRLIACTGDRDCGYGMHRARHDRPPHRINIARSSVVFVATLQLCHFNQISLVSGFVGGASGRSYSANILAKTTWAAINPASTTRWQSVAINQTSL